MSDKWIMFLLRIWVCISYPRAHLMSRVFEIDVARCPRCGTEGMQVIACITDQQVVRDILKHIGQPTAPPEFDPPRHGELGFDEAA